MRHSGQRSGKGRALDDVFVERLWCSVKCEEVYLADYDSPRAAHRGLARYFEFYHHQRPHQALGYLALGEVYLMAATRNQLLTTTTTTT